MKNFVIILTFVFASLFGIAQELPVQENKGILTSAIIIDGDTIPFSYLNEVVVFSDIIFKSKKQAEKYTKLKRDVKKAYPYAIMAAAKLKEYNSVLEKMPTEIQRQNYMKTAEKELKKQFEADLKKLTITQGRILIKLIDRETGTTSYDLVKDLRGSFSAFMWQSLARLFGTNLKSEYDATGDDWMIESIILGIESGAI